MPVWRPVGSKTVCGEPLSAKREKTSKDLILGNMLCKEDVAGMAGEDEINNEELMLARLFNEHDANLLDGMADELSENKVENMDDMEEEKNPSGNEQTIVVVE